MFTCSETCLTILFLCAGAGLVAWAAWSEKCWRDDHKVPVVPTTPLMFIGLVAILLALVHLMTLAGIRKP